MAKIYRGDATLTPPDGRMIPIQLDLHIDQFGDGTVRWRGLSSIALPDRFLGYLYQTCTLRWPTPTGYATIDAVMVVVMEYQSAEVAEFRSPGPVTLVPTGTA